MYRISIANNTYIGSTKDFTQRKRKHKNACTNINNNSYNHKIYQMIRDNGGWDNCEMIPIEEYECENHLHALIREEQLRKEYNANMNTNKSYCSKKEYNTEYWISNKECLQSKKKEWYEQNKDDVNNKKKEWYEQNKEEVLKKFNTKFDCECGGCYTYINKSKHMRTKKHLDYINALA